MARGQTAHGERRNAERRRRWVRLLLAVPVSTATMAYGLTPALAAPDGRGAAGRSGVADPAAPAPDPDAVASAGPATPRRDEPKVSAEARRVDVVNPSATPWDVDAAGPAAEPAADAAPAPPAPPSEATSEATAEAAPLPAPATASTTTAVDPLTGVVAVPKVNKVTVRWNAPAIPVDAVEVIALSDGKRTGVALVAGSAVTTDVTGLAGAVAVTVEVTPILGGVRGPASVPAPVTPTGSATTYASTALAQRPVLYWRLGERVGSVAYDLSTKANPGTYRMVDGVIGALRAYPQLGVTSALKNDPDTSASFPGNCCGDFTTVGASTVTGLPVGDAARSVVGWLRFGGDTVLADYGSSAANSRFRLSLDNRGQRIVLDLGGGQVLTAPLDRDLADGQWHHLAFTYAPGTGGAAGTARAYVDGVRVATWTPAAPLTTATTGFVSQPRGAVDELGVIPSVLSGAEVLALVDASGETIPTTPGSLAAVAGTKANTVTVTWTASSGAAPSPQLGVDHYRVWATAGGKTTALLELGPSARKATLTGLAAGVPQTVSIVAVNGRGQSVAATAAPVAPTGSPAPYAAQVLASNPSRYYRLGDTVADRATDLAAGQTDRLHNYTGTIGAHTAVYTKGRAGALQPAADPDTSIQFGTNCCGDSAWGDDPLAPGLPVGDEPRTVELWMTTGYPTLLAGDAWLRPGGNYGGTLASWGGGSGRRFDIGYNLANTRITVGTGGGPSVFLELPRFAADQEQLDDAKWHHLVVTYREGIVRGFFDGVSMGTANFTAPLDTASGSSYIGGNAGVDEVAIYGSALSADTVAAHFDASGNSRPTAPTAVKAVKAEGAAIVSWKPSTAGVPAGQRQVDRYVVTALLGTGQRGSVIVPGDVTTATVTGLLGAPYTFSVVAVNGFGGSVPGTSPVMTPIDVGLTYAAQILSDAPSLYWRLNEPVQPVVVDSSGFHRDAQFVNVRGVIGAINADVALLQPGAIATDPMDSSVTFRENCCADSTWTWLRSADGLPKGNAPRSVEAWVKTTSGNRIGLADWGQSGAGQRFSVQIDSNSKSVVITTSNSDSFSIPMGLRVNDGAWHHVVVTYEGRDVNVYVDGGRVAWSTLPANLATTTASAFVTSPFATLDELAVYGSALTADQVFRHYFLSGLSAAPASAFGLDPDADFTEDVNTALGNFVWPMTDVTVANAGPALGVSRVYNNQDKRVGIFGKGWSSLYDSRLDKDTATGEVTVIMSDGRRALFTPATAPATGYKPPKGTFGELTTRPDGSWQLKERDRTIYHFATDGRLLDVADGYGRLLTITYDGSGRPSGATGTGGRALTLSYPDASVRLVSSARTTVAVDTPGGNRPLEWRYSYSGDLLKASCDARNPDTTSGRCTRFAYTGGFITKVTDPRGNVDALVKYRIDGRVDWREDAIGNHTTFTALAPGVTSVEDPSHHTTVTSYDGEWRPITTEGPDGAVTSYGYDANGFRNRVTDPNGSTTTQTYDARGNVRSATNGEGNTTWFEYTGDDLVARRDARSSGPGDNTYRTTFTVNAAGEPTTQVTPPTDVHPAGTTTRYAYTTAGEDLGFGPVPAGLLRQVTLPGGGTVVYAYDGEGDLRRRTDPSGLVAAFEQDGIGRTTSEVRTWTEASGPVSATTTNAYDELGMVITQVEPAVTSTIGGTSVTTKKRTTTSYDRAGNVGSVTVDDIGQASPVTPLHRVVNTWFPDDKIETTTHTGGGTTSYLYDVNGNVRQVTDPEGRVFQTERDLADRPVRWKLIGFVDDPEDPAAIPRDVVLKEVDYDKAGRKVAERTPAPGVGGRDGQLAPATTPMREQRTGYDRADRLTSVVQVAFRNRSGISPAARDITLRSLAYDFAGNVTLEVIGGGQRTVRRAFDQAGWLRREEVELGAVDRATDYRYDLDGNVVTSGIGPLGGAALTETRLAWDTSNRLTSQTVENGVDDLVTTFGYDQRGLLTSMVDPRGNGAGAVAADFTTDYTHDALGQLVRQQLPPVTVEEAGAAPVTGRPTKAFSYDAVGNRIVTVDERGAVTRTTFDALDRRVRVDLPPYTTPVPVSTLNVFETWGYDRVGNLTSHQDRRGGTTSVLYDGRNRAVRRLDPLVAGQPDRGASRLEHDDAGNLTEQTDPVGAVTTFVADDLGRNRSTTNIVRQAAPAGAYTSVSDHDDLGNRTYQRDPAGVTTTMRYDADSHLVQETDGLGFSRSWAYDIVGRPLSASDQQGRTTVSGYDPAGRVLTQERRPAPLAAASATKYMSYDAAGNRTDSRSARSSGPADDTFRTSYGYDAANRMTSVTEPSATGPLTTSYGYDPAGRLSRLTDAKAIPATTTYRYNVWGLLEQLVDPVTPTHPDLADRATTISYDTGALPVRMDRPGGSLTTRSYDALGRLTSEIGTAPGRPSASHGPTWDLSGRMTSIDTPGGPIQITWDDRGLLLTTTDPGAETIASSFKYEAGGRMSKRVDAAGTTTTTYTTRGELDVVTDGLTGSTTDRDHNPDGTLASVTYGSVPPSVRTLGYDPLGRLESDTLVNAGTTLAATAYGYDPDDHITSQVVSAPASVAGTNAYGYDPAGRLEQWTRPDSSVVPYRYDGAGNLVLRDGATLTYDARNRLTDDGSSAYTWTADGAISTVTPNGAGSPETMTTDGFGRTVADGTTTYAYDGLDRVTSRNSTPLAYAGTEIDPVKFGPRRYARTPDGDLAAATDGSPTGTGFVGLNQHGDVSWLLGGAGAVADAATYDPTGRILADAGGADLSVGFQGDLTDPTTGKVWMGARWYDPDTGSFTTRDTVFGDPRSPVSLNRYTYAQGDPLGMFDPDGHFSIGGAIRSVGNAVSNVYHRVESAVRSTVSAVTHAATSVVRQVASTVRSVGSAVARATSSTVRAVGRTARQAASATVHAVRTGVSIAAKGVSACVQSSACLRRVAITAALVGVAVVTGGAGAMVLGAALSGGIASMTTCKGKGFGCVYDAALGGAAAGIVPFGPGLGFAQVVGRGAIAGALATGTTELASTGRVDPRSLVMGAIAGGGTAGAFHLGGQALGRIPGVSRVVQRLTGKSEDEGAGLLGRLCRVAHSFAAATAVVMADGSRRAIASVRVGDAVMATDVRTGRVVARAVTAVHRNVDDDRRDLVVATASGLSTIKTTDHHPFWDPARRRWVEAADLRPGDSLQTLDGTAATVSGSTDVPGRGEMFDLTVADAHTFSVAAEDPGSAVLVHNCGDEVADDVADLQLRPKPGWSRQQITAFKAKVKALNAAAKRGELRVTEVERSGTSAASMWRKAGNEIPDLADIDHTIELQLGGLNELSNLNPLNYSVNRSVGAQIACQIRGLAVGTQITSVSICPR